MKEAPQTLFDAPDFRHDQWASFRNRQQTFFGTVSGDPKNELFWGIREYRRTVV
ncbi:MAG TPA: hypothetical protein VEI07_25345 [Planctomycetaceae bacterium]|nr:hypothetical protein [Planctomycetaceae bacterium]